jgi:hypothetical protein
MNLKPLIAWTAVASVIAILIVINIYIKNFHQYEISENAASWGAFGDYFGGVLNPLIGIANLGFLIYISFLIADLDEKRSIRETKSQKEFALFGVKHDAIRQLVSMLDKVHLELFNNPASAYKTLRYLEHELFMYLASITYLFPNIIAYDLEGFRESLVGMRYCVGVEERLEKEGYKDFEGKSAEEIKIEIAAIVKKSLENFETHLGTFMMEKYKLLNTISKDFLEI